jgi:glycosyltransferase involved in cell wall biosynthesis
MSNFMGMERNDGSMTGTTTDRTAPAEQNHASATQRDDQDPEISIVVPMYNEQDSVEELHRRLEEQLRLRGDSYEMVFVDDKSEDGTAACLKALFEKDPDHVRVVSLRRNFGQTAALAAGLDHCRGRIVITMDGDLQHDPADLPVFFEKIDEGYDLVSGWRKQRMDNLIMRRIPSRIANFLMAKLSGVALHDFGTTFKAYRCEILEDLELHGELHRFVPVLLSWQGVRIAEVPIANDPRLSGKSNYGIGRTFRVLFDLLTVKFLISYISRPLHLFGMIGGTLFSIGFVVAAIITLAYYFGSLVVGDNLGNLMFSMLSMMLGVQLIAIGLALEVNVRTYHLASGRRIYAVRSVLSKETR